MNKSQQESFNDEEKERHMGWILKRPPTRIVIFTFLVATWISTVSLTYSFLLLTLFLKIAQNLTTVKKMSIPRLLFPRAPY